MKKNKRRMKIRVYFYDDSGFGKLIDLLYPYISYCHIMETENDYKRAIIGLQMHGFDADMVTENDDDASKLGNSCNDAPIEGETSDEM